MSSILVIFIVFGVNPLLRQYRAQKLRSEIYDANKAGAMRKAARTEHKLKNILLFGFPLIGFIYVLLLLIYISRKVVKPLTAAVEFSDSLARGEFPSKLTDCQTGNDEINNLMKSLNYLRDRLQNTFQKLDKSHKREKSARFEAEKASNLKSRFLSNLSPELRTPLNAINGYMEIISNDLDKGCYDRLLRSRVERIGRNVEILNRMVANLLDIGKLGAEKNYLNITEFNTADFLRELVEYNIFCMHEKDISLVNHLSSDAPERISTDRELLSLLLSTLIRSLARVAGQDEVISCGCRHENNNVVFWVRDNRCAEQHEPLVPLFNKFVPQQDFAATSSPAVLNMMLAATKADGLGATLTAESNSNAATEFKVIFADWEVIPEDVVRSDGPIIASNQKLDQGDKLDELEPEMDYDFENAAASEPLRVLLAEDDADNVEIIRTLLEEDNCSIETAANGKECRKAVDAGCFDLLVISRYLPETDIYCILKNLRSNKATSEVPVIVLTGFLSQNDRQRLVIAGVDRCFIKPINFKLFRNTVRRYAARNSTDSA
ncbi:hybrid sensor histidine kinase/response regulator [Lentisphaerota bacterium ZTH]|nr:response regulator [Lentisphaerota bacterium]WET07354.1 hybrid sensor histidine kinase/response regulator [Lentisphaerota bacterium ZTH]